MGTLPGGGGDNNVTSVSASTMFWTGASPFLLMFLYALCNRRPVDTRYHRGALFRRQAERVWEIERQKQERLDTPLEDRMNQIEKGLRRMEVVSKCPSTGRCVLGPIAEEEAKDDNGESSSSAAAETTEATEITAATSMEEGINDESPKCPSSPGNSDKPLLKSSDQNGGEGDYCDDGEDEHVCPICLDNFEVGDAVMWLNRSDGESCSHVFHEECLMQWLLEQRENECPTCRACFIESSSDDDNCGDDDESDSTSTAATSLEELSSTISATSSSDTEISTGSAEEVEGDNADGNATSTDIEDIEEGIQQEHDDVDSEQEKDEEIAVAEEENFTYVIDKGLVQKVPAS